MKKWLIVSLLALPLLFTNHVMADDEELSGGFSSEENLSDGIISDEDYQPDSPTENHPTEETGMEALVSDGHLSDEAQEQDAAEIPIVSSSTSGKCGDNATWILENGVLTISGTGAIIHGRRSWLVLSGSLRLWYTLFIE